MSGDMVLTFLKFASEYGKKKTGSYGRGFWDVHFEFVWVRMEGDARGRVLVLK